MTICRATESQIQADLISPSEFNAIDASIERVINAKHDNNGKIDYWELERKLDEVHKEVALKAQPHHLHHESRTEARQEFLRSVIVTRDDHIDESKFAESVKKWEIPPLEQDRKEAKQEDGYWKQKSIWGRARAYWAIKGPEIALLTLVATFMVAFGV
ncbi:hypothetical protein BU25DRAFT_459478 [Macroventuria anomochaeta]|uniref:Uncharacterized protein n=1 Tax=Macroventuria anomochaeta TaxID=301207 RepID=A0ACB6RYW0_9PLEO|nr:uncharacterized protein BU25DRAFT_459478 [Macroventuria anomochaeta]KAF2626339.1 hypothetical protein BU25DRAFT_459478 [Macroventuria anomochaeta]